MFPCQVVDNRQKRRSLLRKADDIRPIRAKDRLVKNEEEHPLTTTTEIAENIASEHGLTKVQSKAVVESVLAAISAASVSGNETSLPGFGKFKVKATPEREARNPATGATIKVAAARKLSFVPAKALKDALNK